MSTPITYYLRYFICGLFNDGVSSLQQIVSKHDSYEILEQHLANYNWIREEAHAIREMPATF